jgi:hypothetical protein
MGNNYSEYNTMERIGTWIFIIVSALTLGIVLGAGMAFSWANPNLRKLLIVIVSFGIAIGIILMVRICFAYPLAFLADWIEYKSDLEKKEKAQ